MPECNEQWLCQLQASTGVVCLPCKAQKSITRRERREGISADNIHPIGGISPANPTPPQSTAPSGVIRHHTSPTKIMLRGD
jgi:hypothetical protein